jgi:sn-glycerol 3-phosphate transport system substrate-binding protein
MNERSFDRRKLLIRGGGAAAAALAAGRGVAGAAPSPISAPAFIRNQGDSVKLKFAHMNSWNAEWAADLDTMVSDWNAANADIQVEVIKWTWETYFATLTAAIGADEAPDVMNVGWGEVVELGRPHFLDLTPMLTDEIKAGFNPSSFTSCTYEGQIFGLPAFEQMNQVLYYRSDFAEEAGVTFDGETLAWEGLVDAATKLTKEGRYGLGSSAKGRGIVEPFAPFQYQNGSPMVAHEDGKWVPKFDTDASKEAGKYFLDLWTGSKVINPNNLGKGYTELVNDLGLGTVGMFHGITQNYFALVQQYPDLADKIKIAPPQTKTATSTVGGAFSMSIFKASDHPDQAMKFITWATGKDAMEKYWLPKGQVLSPRTDVASPGMPDEIAAMMKKYQDVQAVFPFATQWETVREKVLSPRLAQLAAGQGDFDSGWKDIQEQAEMTLRNSD